MTSAKVLLTEKSFGGIVQRYEHQSEVCKCNMKFHVFLPPNYETSKVPVLYFLSGLTCTDENFITKSGAIQFAAKHNIMLVAPDTSPRGNPVEGDSDDWSFGVAAGFYVDATVDKWKNAGYMMYSYIVNELPSVIKSNFPNADTSRSSIMGHSMGGHGALVIGLRNPDKYQSVSAFAPICNPMECPWGKKAFSGYLGQDTEAWKAYDASVLLKNYKGKDLHILIDQGTKDKFLEEQLHPKSIESIENPSTSVKFRYQEGYGHGYYFISTFIGDHIEHHAKYLNQQ